MTAFFTVPDILHRHDRGGRAADARHAAFHAEMVREILRRLTPEEASALARGLEGAARFFREKYAAALPAKNSENKGEQSL